MSYPASVLTLSNTFHLRPHHIINHQRKRAGILTKKKSYLSATLANGNLQTKRRAETSGLMYSELVLLLV